MLVKPEEEGGIISRVIKDLFSEVDKARVTTAPLPAPPRGGALASPAETIEFTVSFVEIYMEQIRDLLASGGGSSAGSATIAGGLKIRENAQKGIYIEDMTQVQTQSEHATMELVKSGILNRAVSSTRMNKDSSRSHSILIISCARKSQKTQTVLKRSSMYIVDLAGSEFVNKTNAAGKVLQEAKAINKSLSALSNVIKALVEGKKHVPYRDSKLTRILQDSLGGSAKTCLILAASCSSYNMSETISTLRFGLRAKEIKNPVVQKHGESMPGIGPGGIFKELYQQAMEEIEEKNRKIDELQRLLTAVYQENQQLTESEQLQGCPEQQGEQSDEGWLSVVDENHALGDNEVTRELSVEGEAQTSKAQGGDEDANLDSSSDSEVSDEDEELEAAIREKEGLAQRNTALLEENKRLFHVLEALESQLDQVVVDFSTGKPILSLISRVKGDAQSLSPAGSQQQELSANALAEQEQHLLSLKIWLQCDKWQQSLESRPETELIESVDEVKTCSEPSPNPSPRRSTDPSSTSGERFDQRLSEISASLATSPGSPLLRPCASNTDTTPCVHRIDAEALSRQIVELKLQLHYLSEATKQAMDGESYLVVIENARLKTRIEELEFQANLCTVACNQLEMKNRACETRLSNQETHIGCLQNSLQEYQGLFKQQIVMSQEKCRLLTDELEFYKKLAKCSQQSSQHLIGGSGATSPMSLSPLKSLPSPRKHRSNASSSAFAGLSSSAIGAVKTSSGSAIAGAVTPVMYPEPNQQDLSAGGNPFGLWRGFGSLYKPSKTLPSGEVEIELAERSYGSSSASTSPVSPLSVKMSRPIVKPISRTSSHSSSGLVMAAVTTEQTGGESSFSPWIVKGFGANATNSTRPLLTSRASHLSSSSSREQDATLDELAAPIEMHGH